jgi:hypothetical protein
MSEKRLNLIWVAWIVLTVSIGVVCLGVLTFVIVSIIGLFKIASISPDTTMALLAGTLLILLLISTPLGILLDHYDALNIKKAQKWVNSGGKEDG